MLRIINLTRKTSKVASGNAYEEVAIKQNLPKEYSFTLTSTAWRGEGDRGPYTQTVAIQGISPKSTGVFGLANNVTSEIIEEVSGAQLQLTGQADNSITITAYKLKPSRDIPCVITNVHNAKVISNGEVDQ